MQAHTRHKHQPDLNRCITDKEALIKNTFLMSNFGMIINNIWEDLSWAKV